MQPKSTVSSLSFDPTVHFALPKINGEKVELVGGRRDALRMHTPEIAIDQRLNAVADLLRQGSNRVEATVRAVSGVHSTLLQTEFLSATKRLEAEQTLLTFIQGIIAKLNKSLSNPFSNIGSRWWGGISRLSPIANELVARLPASLEPAQGEQLLLLNPYCQILSHEEAARELTKALDQRDDLQKAFTFRMDKDKPSLFYVVQAVKRPHEQRIEYNVRESQVTLHDDTFTLTLNESDPQHAAFRPDNFGQNEWGSVQAMCQALEGQYGPPLAIRNRSQSQQIASEQQAQEAAHPSNVLPAASAESAVFSPEVPLPVFSVNADSLEPVQVPAPAASADKPKSKFANLNTVEEAIAAGFLCPKIGPIQISRELTHHVINLAINKKGPANFIFHRDIVMQTLNITIQYCTRFGEYPEDFSYKLLEFEISSIPGRYYDISDAGLEKGKKWPFEIKSWSSFNEMICFFLTHCGEPCIVAPRAGV